MLVRFANRERPLSYRQDPRPQFFPAVLQLILKFEFSGFYSPFLCPHDRDAIDSKTGVLPIQRELAYRQDTPPPIFKLQFCSWILSFLVYSPFPCRQFRSGAVHSGDKCESKESISYRQGLQGRVLKLNFWRWILQIGVHTKMGISVNWERWYSWPSCGIEDWFWI